MTANVDTGDETVGFSSTEACFKLVEGRHALNACESLRDILDEPLQVLRRVSTLEELRGILVVAVRLTSDHVPEIGSEDGVWKLSRQDFAARLTTVKNRGDCHSGPLLASVLRSL